MPSANTAYALTGGNGCTYIDGTAATTPPTGSNTFTAVQALTETVLDISAMNSNSYTSRITDFDVDITIPAGSIIYPWATGLVLLSGTCLAYHE